MAAAHDEGLSKLSGLIDLLSLGPFPPIITKPDRDSSFLPNASMGCLVRWCYVERQKGWVYMMVHLCR